MRTGDLPPLTILLVEGTDAAQTVFSEASGINRNLIFLLLGIMLIVAVLQPRSRASPRGGESGRPGQHVAARRMSCAISILGI